MNRRELIKSLGMLPFFWVASSPTWAMIHQPRWERTLVLLELKGGNDGLNTVIPFKTGFPQTVFGKQIETTAQLIASQTGIPVIKISFGGVDTHTNQPNQQSRLLQQMAAGIQALRSAKPPP